MRNKKEHLSIISLVLFVCIIMASIDGILSPDYAIKSFYKVGLFLIIPLGYVRYNKRTSFSELFCINRRNILFSLLLGVGVFLFIMGAYFTVGAFFDFSNVTIALQDKIGVNKNNFIYVALYISFINSLLEEFFFRGFAFLTLKKTTSRTLAYTFSAGAFAFYHVAIMTSWFTLPLFILLIFSLFVAGLLFNWLNEKSGTIYASWMVHMCANFAINTIGFMLFDLI